jgi:hypothetical protein
MSPYPNNNGNSSQSASSSPSHVTSSYLSSLIINTTSPAPPASSPPIIGTNLPPLQLNRPTMLSLSNEKTKNSNTNNLPLSPMVTATQTGNQDNSSLNKSLFPWPTSTSTIKHNKTTLNEDKMLTNEDEVNNNNNETSSTSSTSSKYTFQPINSSSSSSTNRPSFNRSQIAPNNNGSISAFKSTISQHHKRMIVPNLPPSVSTITTTTMTTAASVNDQTSESGQYFNNSPFNSPARDSPIPHQNRGSPCVHGVTSTTISTDFKVDSGYNGSDSDSNNEQQNTIKSSTTINVKNE